MLFYRSLIGPTADFKFEKKYFSLQPVAQQNRENNYISKKESIQKSIL